MKVHLHSEQFDGWLHAECGAGDWPVADLRCVDAGPFELLARSVRCSRCTRYWWPRGGSPAEGLTDVEEARRQDEANEREYEHRHAR